MDHNPQNAKRRQRTPEHKEALRVRIIHRASELFVAQGYEKFSMRRLAALLGYSPATLYLYFKDKDDLLFTVVDQGFIDFERRLTAACAACDDPWQRLAQLAEAYVEFGLKHPISYQLMFMWRIDFLTESRSGAKTPRIEALRVLHDAVRYAIEKGVFKPGDAEAYGDVLWAVVHGIVALAIQVPGFDGERTGNLTDHAKRMVYEAFSQ